MGKSIVSPFVLIIVAIVIIIGYFIESRIIIHKLVYTPEREKELEVMNEYGKKGQVWNVTKKEK